MNDVINKNLAGDIVKVFRIKKEVWVEYSDGRKVFKKYATPKKARQYQRKLKTQLSKTASKAGYDAVIHQWDKTPRRKKLKNKEYKND